MILARNSNSKIRKFENFENSDKPGARDSVIVTSSLERLSSPTSCTENPARSFKLKTDRKKEDKETETDFSLVKTNSSSSYDRKTLLQQKTLLFDRKHDDRKTIDRKQEATMHEDRSQEDRGGDSAYLQGSRPEADLEMLPGIFLSSPPSASSSCETVPPPAGTAVTRGGGGGLISPKISIFDKFNCSYHAGKPRLPHTAAEQLLSAGEKTTAGCTALCTSRPSSRKKFD